MTESIGRRKTEAGLKWWVELTELVKSGGWAKLTAVERAMVIVYYVNSWRDGTVRKTPVEILALAGISRRGMEQANSRLIDRGMIDRVWDCDSQHAADTFVLPIERPRRGGGGASNAPPPGAKKVVGVAQDMRYPGAKKVVGVAHPMRPLPTLPYPEVQLPAGEGNVCPVERGEGGREPELRPTIKELLQLATSLKSEAGDFYEAIVQRLCLRIGINEALAASVLSRHDITPQFFLEQYSNALGDPAVKKIAGIMAHRLRLSSKKRRRVNG